jgi:alkylhydroperoxidase family enzyme
MPRIAPSASGDTNADRVMGHRPELSEAWEELGRAFHGPSSTLTDHLKEEVRRTLAQRTGCQFCASLGLPIEDQATSQESLAVEFAESVAIDYQAITDRQVEVLLEEFTAPQVVELLLWITYEYAGQMFGSLIADDPATPEEQRAFAAAIGRPSP